MDYRESCPYCGAKILADKVASHINLCIQRPTYAKDTASKAMPCNEEKEKHKPHRHSPSEKKESLHEQPPKKKAARLAPSSVKNKPSTQRASKKTQHKKRGLTAAEAKANRERERQAVKDKYKDLTASEKRAALAADTAQKRHTSTQGSRGKKTDRDVHAAGLVFGGGERWKYENH